ncbi:MAG: hypothetical protein ACYDHC_13425, partial [Desulfuromonadaceae bacterium]
EVKPLRADDTARVAVWESRSPPGILNKTPRNQKWMRGVLRWKSENGVLYCQLFMSLVFCHDY